MQLLAQRPADSWIVVQPFPRPKGQSLAELFCIADRVSLGRESRCFADQMIFFVFLRGDSPGLIYDQLRKAQKFWCFHLHASRRALIGMNQNPDMKRVSQRSLFARVVHKPLELPIHKQHELQTAIAELLVNALTEVPVKEANIDDDEQ
jgi:hypothetical protein